MGYLLPGLLLALFAGLIQFTLPYFQRTYLLLSEPSAQYKYYEPIISQLLENGTCKFHHSELLMGCEDMHFDGKWMWTGCMESAEKRRKYMPGVGMRDLERERTKNGGVGKEGYMRDRFVRWDVETDEAVEMELRGFPEDVDLVLHGFDINILSPTNITFYIINHRPFASVIEKFWHTPGTHHLNYIKTIEIPPTSAGGAPNPNDVLAIPELDQENAFYVTNDHMFREGILRNLEDIFRTNFGSHLSYYDEEEGWKIVVKSVSAANGITGTKHMQLADSAGKSTPRSDINEEDEEADGVGVTEEPPKSIQNTVYLSSCTAGLIKVFSREYATYKLTHLQDVVLPALGDNPSLSYPSQSRVFIATHEDPILLRPSVVDPKKSVSPSGVYWFRTGQVGEGFYGKGFTGEVTIETLLVDKKGRLANGASTAVFVEKEEGRGDFYVTGLMTEGIAKCNGIFI